MRVLLVAKKFPPMIGGDATAIAALARATRATGLEVEILTHAVSDGPHEVFTHRVGPPQTGAGLDRITIRRLRGLAALRRWAKRTLPDLRPDVVHAHSVDVGYAVAPVARAVGIPTVLTCHGVWFPALGRRSPRGWLECALIRRGRYDAITSVDGASVSSLRSAGFPDATVVPNGVSLEEFAGAKSRNDVFRFLFAGRHEPQKGLDVLLRAAARARQTLGDGFRLLLVGEGSSSDRLREDARSAKLEDIVHFSGALPRPSLVQEFRRADAFVLPSRHEGFPVAILEAWAARLPVIATSVGGVPEVCADGAAVLVPPDDPEALAAAMIALMRDGDRRNALAASGYRLAQERFSWEAVAKRYGSLYERLVKR